MYLAHLLGPQDICGTVVRHFGEQQALLQNQTKEGCLSIQMPSRSIMGLEVDRAQAAQMIYHLSILLA